MATRKRTTPAAEAAAPDAANEHMLDVASDATPSAEAAATAVDAAVEQVTTEAPEADAVAAEPTAAKKPRATKASRAKVAADPETPDAPQAAITEAAEPASEVAAPDAAPAPAGRKKRAAAKATAAADAPEPADTADTADTASAATSDNSDVRAEATEGAEVTGSTEATQNAKPPKSSKAARASKTAEGAGGATGDASAGGEASEANTAESHRAVVEGFGIFGLSEPVMRAIDEMGFETPTEIQRGTIRLLMEGRDVLAQAQTGTGKTAAFGLPLVERVDPRSRQVQGLVLAPTRELAVQVAEALHQFGKYRGVRVLPVYGGQPYERQMRGLRDGAHIVVGTPGRLLDHLRRGSLQLGEVRLAILDEADEMLNMGFLEDVETILGALRSADVQDAKGEAGAGTENGEAPGSNGAAQSTSTSASTSGNGQTQIALFSATLPPPVGHLARRYMQNPVRIDVARGLSTVPQIDQVAYEVGGMDKLDALARVLDVETPGSAIVFCATKRAVDEVADRLAVRGYRVAPLHGDMAQGERERTLRRFRDGQVEMLVATDVAARGLDVENVTHVVNFDIPWDAEAYVHRIGRTGRAGRAGDAITLVTSRNFRLLRTIEQALKVNITRKRLPSLADVAVRRREATKEAVTRTLEAGELDGYLTLAGELGDAHDPVEVAAAARRLWDLARSTTDEGGTLAGAMSAAQQEARDVESRAAREAEERATREASRETTRQARESRMVDGRRTASEYEADGQAPEKGMTRLFVSMGRGDGLRPQDLVGAIANEAGLRGKDVGSIDIYDRFTFVEVPSGEVERVVAALTRTGLRGRPVGVRPAGDEPMPPKPPREGPPRDSRGFGDGPPRQSRGFGADRPSGPPRWDRGDRADGPGRPPARPGWQDRGSSGDRPTFGDRGARPGFQDRRGFGSGPGGGSGGGYGGSRGYEGGGNRGFGGGGGDREGGFDRGPRPGGPPSGGPGGRPTFRARTRRPGG